MRHAYWLRNMNQADMCLLDIFGVKLKHLHARHGTATRLLYSLHKSIGVLAHIKMQLADV